MALVAWRATAEKGLGHGVTDSQAARVTAGLALGAVLVFGGLTSARYLTWHSFIHDLGSYDQKIWLASTEPSLSGMVEQTYQGGVKVSPCGSARYWGVCHFQPLHVVYALLYRLSASPLFLLGTQALLVASGVIPCYLLARVHLESPVSGVLAAALYLLHPAVQHNGLLDFRPDHVAIPFFLWAYLLVERGREWRAVAATAVPALAKESLLLSFAAFGLYFAFLRRRAALGLSMLFAGCVAFYFVTFHVLAGAGYTEGAFLINRYFSGGQNFFSSELILRKVLYIGALFGPLAFLPLLAPLTLLPAVPSLAISLLSSDVTHASFRSQYTAAAIGPLFAALFAVLAWLPRRFGPRAAPARILFGLLVLSASATFVLGPTPLSISFWSRSIGAQWHYSQYLPDRQDVLNEAAKLIPSDPDVMVVSQNDLNSARLAHRHYYFAFPNGLERADYVFLDTRRMPFVYWVAKDRRRYEEIVAQLRGSKEYRIVFDREGVLLFERVGERRPGAPDRSLAPAPPGAMPQ